MREKAGANSEIAKQYRERALNKLFGELYCGDEPMDRTDRYDKTRIKRVATEYLRGAGVELPKSGTHTNAIERTLRGVEPEERHTIPGAVMAIVVSEAMFRSSSVLDFDEKQELYSHAYETLLQTEMLYQRGGWARFYTEAMHRSHLLLTHELNDLNVSQKVKQELLALYDLNFDDDQDEGREKKRPRSRERPGLARRIGRYFLQGLGATAGMVGPTEFDHRERRPDDDGDTDDDWRR